MTKQQKEKEIIDMITPQGMSLKAFGEGKNLITKKELCEFLTEEIGKIEEKAVEIHSRLESLIKKFTIVTNNDSLKPSYEILFNTLAQRAEDDIATTIFNRFIQDYGLDFTELKDQVKDFKETIHYLDLTERGVEFCEVDIFDLNNKPKEC